MPKKKSSDTPQSTHADLDYRVFCPRCGDLAPMELSIHTHVPYDAPGRGGRTGVSFTISACRNCAIIAAEKVVAFMRERVESPTALQHQQEVRDQLAEIIAAVRDKRMRVPLMTVDDVFRAFEIKARIRPPEKT